MSNVKDNYMGFWMLLIAFFFQLPIISLCACSLLFVVTSALLHGYHRCGRRRIWIPSGYWCHRVSQPKAMSLSCPHIHVWVCCAISIEGQEMARSVTDLIDYGYIRYLCSVRAAVQQFSRLFSDDQSKLLIRMYLPKIRKSEALYVHCSMLRAITPFPCILAAFSVARQGYSRPPRTSMQQCT